MNWQKLYNPLMAGLLRSPLHGFLSRSLMLITITGRKSGQRYTTPVNYIRDGETLLVTSQADRTWWKNLRGGAPLSVHLEGRSLPGRGEVLEGPEAANGLLPILRQAPAYRQYFQLELDADGQPQDLDAFTQLAQERAIIRISFP